MKFVSVTTIFLTILAMWAQGGSFGSCGTKISSTLCQTVEVSPGDSLVKTLINLNNKSQVRIDTIKAPNCNPDSIGKPCDYTIETTQVYDTSKTKEFFLNNEVFSSTNAIRLLTPTDTSGAYAIQSKYVVNFKSGNIKRIAEQDIVQTIDLLGTPSTKLNANNTFRFSALKKHARVLSMTSSNWRNLIGRAQSKR